VTCLCRLDQGVVSDDDDDDDDAGIADAGDVMVVLGADVCLVLLEKSFEATDGPILPPPNK